MAKPDEATVTESEVVAAFNEWERRHAAAPEMFQGRVAYAKADNYGTAAARYLLRIITDLRGEVG